MQRFYDWFRDSEGRGYPGAIVTVYNVGTTTLAALYNAGGSLTAPVGISNPLTTDPNGFYSFAIANGTYDIHLQGGGMPTTIIPNLTIGVDGITTLDASDIAFIPTGTIASANVQAAIAEVSSDVTTLDGNALHITGDETASGIKRFTSQFLVGASAASTDFPNAAAILSKGDSGHTYTNNIGLVGESLSAPGFPGIGLGGVAKTNDGFPAYGVAGRALVGATGDSGAAVGVEGLSEATHAGGSNIAFWAQATNGLYNYSFYGNSGTMYNVGPIYGANIYTNSKQVANLPDLADASGVALGDALIAVKQPFTGAVARTLHDKNAETVSIYDFMTAAQIADAIAGTLTLDMAAAFTAAIAAVSAAGGGTIKVPAGRYKTTTTIYLTSGVNLIGEGYLRPTPTASWEGTSSIYAVHSGAAILSLKGANGCRISGISLEGDLTTHPKTGLCLGRSTAASAGFHNISRLGVFGYFSQAAIYTIASEANTWSDLYVWLFGGGAKYCFYTGTKDLLTVDTLVESTNLINSLEMVTLISSINDANSACIYMDIGVSMGSWTFLSCYLTAYSGSYIQMNVGTDGAYTPLGPFTFVGTSGERLSGGDPLYGYKLTASVAVSLSGLNILGSRFDLQAGTSHYTISQSANLTLLTPAIVLQPPEAYPYASDGLLRGQIYGGIVSYGRGSTWTAATLAGSWVNVYGSPYAQAGYCIDSDGVVRVRGTVQSGSGAIFTLPVGFRPAFNMFFPVYASGGMGRVLVTAATGVVSLTVGTSTEVDLSTIQFNSI